MEFRILGSLEVRTDAGPVTPAGAKPRALLAMLLLHANEPVSTERLAIALWGEDAPAGAAKTIRVHVSRLRRALREPDVLATTPAGYRLHVLPGELDADRFEQLAAEGHRALADGAAEHAGRVLREALSLWRGPALADVAFEAFAQAEIARLEDERLAALEARVEADLALGHHAELAGELAQLVAAHPLRERLHGQLMLALYRSGRQADALEAYRDARVALVEQLGLEPGPELRELERAILAHDPALDQSRPAARAAQRATAARIPAPPTPTIGRETDLAGLRADLLGESSGRLVTLVGPGGVGKTRLALELARSIADEFRDGAYFVSLAPIGSFEEVASTIVRQLDVMLLPSESADHGLARHLGDRDVLLVLDNFEHLLDAAGLVADVLAATSRLRVLVTSREPLQLRAERLFRLDPLALPSGDGNGLEQTPAVALFLAVARARDASFALGENGPAVAGMCRRLDGLPLAIELAAARIGLLTVPELADRLREGLDALGIGPRDVPARQRTLTATLDWSYALLTADERAALAGLSVFAGGCTLEAAERVTGASLEVLEALVAKNLVVGHPAGDCPARLTLLETVADFARERLAERGDADDVRGSHLEYYLAMAERAAPELERSDPPAVMAELDREVHNMRAALAWVLDRGATTSALRLATALHEYWDRRGAPEGARWLRAALALPGDVEAPLRAAALEACAWCMIERSTAEDAKAAASESLRIARSIGDLARCAAALNALAASALELDEFDEGYRCATEAERLALEAGDEPKRLVALSFRALTAPQLSDALELGEQVVAGYRRVGSGRRLALLQSSFTYTALVRGDYASARRLTPDALQAAEALGDPFVLGFAAGNEGLVALFSGDHVRASDAFTRELQLANEYRYDRLLYEAISGLAAVAAAGRQDECAARLIGAAEGTRLERHPPELERQLEDGFFAPARSRLGEAAWTAARAAGSALARGEAVDAALGVDTVASRAGG